MGLKCFYRPIFIGLSAALLIACASTKSPEENNEAEQSVKTAKINAQLGMAYLEIGNIHRAKQKLLLALQENSTIPEPWYSMGFFMEKTGNKEEAQKYYLKAVQIAPNRGDSHNNYGTFLCRNGHYSESIQHFLMAVKDASYLDSAGAYENAGTCAMKMHDNQQAKAYFKQALVEDPERESALYKMAELNYKLGDYKAAKDRLDAFVAITKPSSESQMLYAKLAPLIAKHEPSLHRRLPTNSPNDLA